MQQRYNFSAGPATLPKEVLIKAQSELLNWQNQGSSVLEVSHRGKPFIEVAEKAEHNLRKLLNISDEYAVLFMHGGGRGQFSCVPLNVSQENQITQHLVTGQWSIAAEKEARKFTQTEIVATSKVNDDGNTFVPKQTEWHVDPDAAYFHYCSNETVEGIEINWIPQTGNVPLVADMSSNILSKPFDINQYDIVYAGAQKNIGPSGLTIVIVKKSLLGNARISTPSIFDYQLQYEKGSMYNTPPTFSWYLAGLVFEWLQQIGGLAAIEKANIAKASLLYTYIDSSDFYNNSVETDNRSKMNVTFTLNSSDLLDAAFLDQSAKAGLMALKGHRSVGGMRASIYNAMPIDGVKALIGFMKEFERKMG